ncbi:hypothetical protein B9479_004319 [Cryptococcus floricola]|uniref:Uncharacterized protein n=1 Tax=Cryptococcus floricola TaxID=2591691 RepID=A0A5D3AW90_9TREE|nr:hypothetical protein B9479_004319 [Cryptococcus floricola]
MSSFGHNTDTSPPSSSPLPTSTTATATTTGPKHRHNEHTLPDGTRVRVIEDERTWGGEDGGGVGKVVIKRWERPAGSHAAGERGGGVGAGEGGVGGGGMEREHLLRDVRLNHTNDALFSRFLQPPSDASEATDTRAKRPSEDFFSDAFFPLPMPSFGRLVFPEEDDPSLLPPHLSAPQAATNPKPHHTPSTTPSNPQIRSWSYASSGSLSGWGLVAGMVAVGAGVWGWRGRKRVKVLEQRVRDLTRGSQMSARANVVRPAPAAQATPGSAGSLAPATPPTAATGQIEALQKRVEELENALRSMGSLTGTGEKRQGGRVLDELRKAKEEKTE